ncbi:ApeP family dehydratase [Achromobacter denitrificans]
MNAWPIATLLPHAGAAILLDEVLSWDAETLTAAATVRPGPYSLPDGSLPPWLGLEFMAQAVGAWAGCHARAAGAPVRLGFLVGTRSYECASAGFPSGARLTVSAERSLSDGAGISLFECTLSGEAGQLAHARLNVYQPDDPLAYIQEEAPA